MNISAFIDQEVKPALGCTETGAVALAAAKAADHLENSAKHIHVEASGNLYKNGVKVGVPGTNGGTGINLAAALGAIAGKSELGLSSLDKVTSMDILKAEELIKLGNVTSAPRIDVPYVYVKVTIQNSTETVTVTTKYRHDNIVKIKKNSVTIYENETKQEDTPKKNYLDELAEMNIEQLWSLASNISEDIQQYLIKGAEMNLEIAYLGASTKWALGVGYGIDKLQNNDLLYRIKAMAGGASDARVGGASYEVMSSAGSGNHGITAIIPVTLVAQEWEKTEKELAEALMLSHLVTRYIKIYSGLLSPVCGCAIAAGAGSAAAIVKLGGGTPKQAEIAVANLIGSVMGMVCDGAKGSCSLKVSTAAGESYIYALLALKDHGIGSQQGLLKPDLHSIGVMLKEVSERGLCEMDKIMIDIIQRG